VGDPTAAPSRYAPYETTPTLSDEALHETLSWLALAAVNHRLAGWAGGSASADALGDGEGDGESGVGAGSGAGAGADLPPELPPLFPEPPPLPPPPAVLLFLVENEQGFVVVTSDAGRERLPEVSVACTEIVYALPQARVSTR
jgi:hypothetical protein